MGIAGQVALKSAAVDAPNLAAQLFNPLTFLGLVIYALASIGYIVALNRIPVSVAFPSVAASYAIVAVLGPCFVEGAARLGAASAASR